MKTMKQIRFFGIAALAALSFVACNKEQEFVVPAEKGELVTITAVREGYVPPTKTVLVNSAEVWWSPMDRVSVFYGPESEPIVFAGQNEEAAPKAQFTGEIAGYVEGSKTLYAIYPVSEKNYVDNQGNFSVSISPEQVAVPGSFNTDLFPMVAQSDGLQMSFRNVAGGLKVSVGDEKVNRIVIRANGKDGDPLAGDITVTLKDGVPALTGIISREYEVTLLPPQGEDYFTKGEFYYAVLYPAKLNDGITITLIHGDETPDLVLSSDKAQTVKRSVFGVLENLHTPVLKVEKLWSKVSESGTAWNTYFGGTADTDRSIAMDDEYIYLPETRGVAKMWKISVADPETVAEVPVGGVTGGTHLLSCPRMMPNTSSKVNGGNDVLVVSNLILSDADEDISLYFYENGTSADPTRRNPPRSWWGRRLGDKFTYWGSLQNGAFFFKDFNNLGTPGAFIIYKTAWDQVAPNDWWTVRRREVGANESGIGNFFPFPGQEAPIEGIYASDNGASYIVCNENPASGGSSSGTFASTVTQASGYYRYAFGFQFFELGGNKYIAYAKKDPEDGTALYFFIIGGNADTWKGILDNRKVVYSDHFSGGMSSGFGNADCTMRVIGDEVYFAALRQMNGLSVYKAVFE